MWEARREARREEGEGGERGGQMGKACWSGADWSIARPAGVRRECRQGRGEEGWALSCAGRG